MRLRIISVGRKAADRTSPLTEDYLNRISKFIPVEDVVLKPASDDRIVIRMLKESQKSQVSIALDERGKEYNSYDFAHLFNSWMNDGVSEVAFFIGGAEGLPGEIKKKAKLIALSKMTLPHRLARLILTEQIYRALCIIRKVPYQK
jgi:23S rRNA (pseudouridine1915-N3)-methyltransferase